MNSLLDTEYNASARPEEKSVDLEAVDAESLLVEWLNELAYWAETELLVFHKFDLHSVSSTHIKATIRGSRVAQLENHIKAVTYHQIEVKKEKERWRARIIFDL